MDGRNSRAEATRAAIIEAARALMLGGDFRPPLVAVAKAADRSVRSVFQHFRTIEGLHAVAIEDPLVRRAILGMAADSDVSCLDWPVELQDAVLHAIIFGRPMPARALAMAA